MVRTLFVAALLACFLLPVIRGQQSVGGNGITLTPGQCSGITFNALGEGFNYTAAVNTIVVPDGCKETDIHISKLYAQNSCANVRNNSWVAGYYQCVPVTDNSQATCQNVYATGPKTAFLTANLYNSKPLNNTPFDDDVVTCFPTPAAYFFVWNNCTAPLLITFDLFVTTDLNYPCSVPALQGEEGLIAAEKKAAEQAGGSGGLSSGAIAGIVIGVLIGVAIIGALVWFCCCGV